MKPLSSSYVKPSATVFDSAINNWGRVPVGKPRAYPRADDPRVVDGMIFPNLLPRFTLKPGETVFTIGSCFAREIERHLDDFDLPTMRIALGPELAQGAPNSILNEYNAASMSQRIAWAISGRDTTAMTSLTSRVEGGSVDLLLSKGEPVGEDKILEIRGMIDKVYTALPVADCVILTLGMTEAWYDNETGVYLNRLPNLREVLAQPQRFSFVNMTPQSCHQYMAEGIQELLGRGVSKILLTVSPVPLAATFEKRDCFVANGYSKATLRVAAEMLTRDFPQVDYFPSYEMVMSGGMNAYLPDHQHARPEVVAQIMDHLVRNYIER